MIKFFSGIIIGVVLTIGAIVGYIATLPPLFD